MTKPFAKCCLAVMLIAQGLLLSANADDSVFQASTGHMTLSECIQISIRDNPGFLSYKENLAYYEKQAQRAHGEMLPQFYFDWSGSQNDGGDGDYQLYARISQPLYRGEALTAQWKRSELDREKARLELIRQAQQTVFDVKSAWYRLLEARALEAESALSLERLRQHALFAERFFKEGMIWRNDVLEAEVEVARGEQDLAVAENDTAIALARLNTLLHRKVAAPIKTAGRLEMRSFKESFEEAVEIAHTRRPDLVRLQLDLERSHMDEKAARSRSLPSVNAEAKWGLHSDEVTMYSPRDVGSVGISASWNFWSSGRNENELAAAKARVRQARLNVENAMANLELGVQSAWLSVRESEKRVTVLDKALTQGEENFRVNRIRYTERLGTAKDVLDAQDLLTRTRRDHIHGIADFLVALALLDFEVGRETPVQTSETTP